MILLIYVLSLTLYFKIALTRRYVNQRDAVRSFIIWPSPYPNLIVFVILLGWFWLHIFSTFEVKTLKGFQLTTMFVMTILFLDDKSSRKKCCPWKIKFWIIFQQKNKVLNNFQSFVLPTIKWKVTVRNHLSLTQY